MSRGSSGARVRAVARDWAVPPPQPGLDETDERLRTGLGRTGLLQVLIDHDSPAVGPCPRCGWVPSSIRRDCPSRVMARCLLADAPFPTWLAHLGAQIPGARTGRTEAGEDERREAEDAAPGLFPAPARVPTDRHGRST